MTLQPGFHFSNRLSVTTSASRLPLTFGIMIYLTLISTIFPYQCINLHHFFLLINIYELRFFFTNLMIPNTNVNAPKCLNEKLSYF